MPVCLSLYSPVMLMMLPFHFSAILSINLPVCLTIHFVIDIVNGGWNSWQAWGAWSSCDRACGRGRRVRYGVRECNNPSPKNGGARCPGSHIRKNSGSCLLKHCPGKYSNIQYLQTSYVRWTVSPPIHQSVHISLLRFVCLVLFFYKFIIDAQ